jgi:glycosyltransferase involved in cell wall biosynthesis
MQILFYDPMTPIAYDGTTPMQQGLGGTEATVIRIAQALKDHHTIYIAQHCRESSNDLVSEGVHYISLTTAHQLKPDAVILLRSHKTINDIATHFPKARRFLWLHNMPSSDLHSVRLDLLKNKFELIAVSKFHQSAIQSRLKGKWYQQLLNFKNNASDHFYPPIHVMYNPISDLLQPDNTPIKANQLLFMSSPNKGLAETLRLFETVLKHYPEYNLLIANPGYYKMDLTLPVQASFMGALPHHQVINTLRESFCVFYPQQERVETFGLIYAEANAVGTPVLAHDFGAAKEVLSDAGQAIDCSKAANVIDKLTEWRQQRPAIQGKEQFKLNSVLKNWLDLLN